MRSITESEVREVHLIARKIFKLECYISDGKIHDHLRIIKILAALGDDLYKIVNDIVDSPEEMETLRKEHL